ncbi:hypothetical protein ACIP5Z_06390 [Rothia terrae]|uniref:hypothetical protein n=1 Tax=Rothia terrae TaxID=396015 RepID=UPI0038188370
MTLTIHYALGQLIDIYEPSIWAENWHWFVLAAVAIAPLSLVGAFSHHPTLLGLFARCVLPAGALAEALMIWSISPSYTMSWTFKYADYMTAAVLLCCGVIGLLVALRSYRSYPSTQYKSRRARP